MSRRLAGVTFVFLSGILHIAKYMVAAIFGSSMQSWSDISFNIVLEAVGDHLDILAVISLIAGVIYLIAAEYVSYSDNKDKRDLGK
ncbi:hypothetical protein [Paenibacillus sp. KS-LC4]|uniref:hypothetical protein n=1 Tax=Paenibacillus sp. KS-LC4 TaxID=2979727 RepID=UPI0030CA9A8A